MRRFCLLYRARESRYRACGGVVGQLGAARGIRRPSSTLAKTGPERVSYGSSGITTSSQHGFPRSRTGRRKVRNAPQTSWPGHHNC